MDLEIERMRVRQSRQDQRKTVLFATNSNLCSLSDRYEIDSDEPAGRA